MNKFIQVHVNGVAHLINLAWVEEITQGNHGTTIYFAFNIPDALEQDYLVVDESYEDLYWAVQKVGK